MWGYVSSVPVPPARLWVGGGNRAQVWGSTMSASEGIWKWLESVRRRGRNREEGEVQLIFGETSQILLRKGGRKGISFTFSCSLWELYLAIQFSPQTVIHIPNPCAAAQPSKHSACSLDITLACWKLKAVHSICDRLEFLQVFFKVFRMLWEANKKRGGFWFCSVFLFSSMMFCVHWQRQEGVENQIKRKKWPLEKITLKFFSSKSHLEK